jgi:hypothetical protein
VQRIVADISFGAIHGPSVAQRLQRRYRPSSCHGIVGSDGTRRCMTHGARLSWALVPVQASPVSAPAACRFDAASPDAPVPPPACSNYFISLPMRRTARTNSSIAIAVRLRGDRHSRVRW